MNRRELIQHVAYLMGGAISAPAILAVLNGCSAKSSAEAWRPVFLTQEQGEIVAEIAEIILPRTNTPGAKDVGVPAFIDTMLRDAYTTADHARYIAGLNELDAQAKREHQRRFIDLDGGARLALVQRVHDEATKHELTLITLPPAQLKRPFILMTKELTLLGFFTSQIGATQVLQYDPVPGAYRGCVPLAQAGNGKQWALETSIRF
jgi:gluconate 2-dehydrogenase gamma chain